MVEPGIGDWWRSEGEEASQLMWGLLICLYLALFAQLEIRLPLIVRPGQVLNALSGAQPPHVPGEETRQSVVVLPGDFLVGWPRGAWLSSVAVKLIRSRKVGERQVLERWGKCGLVVRRAGGRTRGVSLGPGAPGVCPSVPRPTRGGNHGLAGQEGH